MTAVGLLACTICWWLHVRGFGVESAVWGYRALMLGWAIYALCIVSALWWLAAGKRRKKGLSPIAGTARRGGQRGLSPYAGTARRVLGT